MRYVTPLLVGLAVSSCAAPPPAETSAYAARQQEKLAELTAGKVVGAPLSCVSTYPRKDMTVINDNTVVFRQGRQLVYVNHMNGGCTNLESGHTALVTRSTQTQLCRGDIAEIVDTSTHMTVGSCSFGDFVPYTMAGTRY